MTKYFYVPEARSTSDGFLSNPKAGWKAHYTARYFNEGLADVGNDETLYIVGHGTFAGTSLQTWTADGLFTLLKKEKLPAGHRRFYLFSCYSGVKMPGAEKSFAESFTYAIRDHYKSATVIGYLGAVQFKRGGGTLEKTVSSITTFGGLGDNYEQVGRAKGQKVSFSVARKLIGSNNVRADQQESYIADIKDEIQTADWMGEVTTLTAKRIVVLGATT